MHHFFLDSITEALDAAPMSEQVAADAPRLIETGEAELPSCFAVSDLAIATIAAAATELATVIGARKVAVDRRLASLWFDMTTRPEGWRLPDAWDALAGVYAASDGWMRLHTNAPHHRQAALCVLGCPGEMGTVAAAVSRWRRSDLEMAIVAEGGAAAALHSIDAWAAHPQGHAVAAEPLIAWTEGDTHCGRAALKGLKVLDLTRVLAGPVATRLLAGFGADVLRIDPPWWDESGVVPEVTLGKRRAGLDLRQGDDRRTFEELLSRSDVLVHGYRPGALETIGYDQDRRREIVPGLIDVSLSAYGWTGPWRARRGFDSLVQMSCGIAHEGMHKSGSDRPVPLPVQALDHATGYLMAAAVLRALRLRNATGTTLSARLSLARTAHLLISAGSRGIQGAKIDETSADLDPAAEAIGWGPARRVRFPVRIDGAGPHWRYTAGPLRAHSAAW